MTWLLTGGAGYIGAHIVRAFGQVGMPLVVLDDLSTGHRRLVPDGVPFVEASVRDADAVRAALTEHDVTGIVHLAAKKAVGESVERPLYYWRENVGGFETLLSVATDVGVRDVVLSSSAAVYGTPETAPVMEDVPLTPESTYGETKLACEWMLRRVGAASGLRWSALRYFNVAGAGAPDLGDTSVTNLVPLVFTALSSGRRPQVFGDDYSTRDGTCVRDYIHVADLADAHVAAAQRLEAGPCGEVYNVGRGEGVTVKEVLEVARSVTGEDFAYDVAPRRAGDPAACFADVSKIDHELGWTAGRDLEDMVRTAWQAWNAPVGAGKGER
ncbi:MAG: UDP-glucose 4-epimerase GalE [Actinomycetes bacterium]